MKPRARCQEYVPFPRNISTPCLYGKLKNSLENYFPFKNADGGRGVQHTSISIFPLHNFFKVICCVSFCVCTWTIIFQLKRFSLLDRQNKTSWTKCLLTSGEGFGGCCCMNCECVTEQQYLESLQLTYRACLSLGEDRGGFRLLFTLGKPVCQACVPTPIKQQNWIPLMDLII